MPDTTRVIAEMDTLIQRWESSGDNRAIFLGCYKRMTQNMIGALADDQFQDGLWVSGLLHHFASYYFAALKAYDRDVEDTPLVWRETFDAAYKSDALVISHLLLGVNAHINYDLVLALVDVLERDWPDSSSDLREMRHADHSHVNQIIAETVDLIQDEVIERYAPEMDLVDKLLGPLDEWATAKLIAGWREDVWDKAVQMLEAGGSLEREEIRQEIEKSAINRSRYFI